MRSTTHGNETLRQTAIAVAAAALCLLADAGNAQSTYELGGMYTFHYRDGRYADWGDYALRGARIAIDDINRGGHLDGDRLSLRPENTIDYHCWPADAALMAETLMKKDILALTGADCSGPAVDMARVAERYEVPVISNGANASMLSSAREFPWFVRVVPPSEAYEGYLVDVAAQLGVTGIAYFHTTDAWGLGARKVIHEATARHGLEILQEYGFARDTDFDTIKAYMAKVRDAGVRHIVMTGPTPDTVTLFRTLQALDMNRPGYTFYAAEMISADEESQAVKGSLGYFAPMAQLPPSDALDDFRASLERSLGHPVDVDSKAFFYGALSYDHIQAVAHAIHSIKEDALPVNRAHLMQYLRGVDFTGITGRIAFAPGSNDRRNMPIQIFNNHGYKDDGRTVDFVSVGTVDQVTGKVQLDLDRVLWPGGTRQRPVP